MIELKVRQVGDGLGIELPADVIETLGAGDGDSIYLINMLNGSYRLARHDEDLVETLELVDGMMHEEDA